MHEQPQDIFDRIMSLPLLRALQPFYQKKKGVLLYLFFGGCTTLISVVSFFLFHTYCRLNELIANIFSWILAVLFAYITNRIWVFRSEAAGAAIFREMLSFFSGRLATLGVEELLLFVGISLLHWNSLLVKIAAQLAVLLSNYFISKLLVFRSR